MNSRRDLPEESDTVSINIMRVKKKALELIARIECEGAYTHLVMQGVAESGELSATEYPVLLQLVKGTLEQRGILEDRLEQFLPKGLCSLPLEVQHALRLGAYQILFLERAKKRDAVYESVELIKTSRWKGFASLVNAVLRKIDPPDSSVADQPVTAATRNFPDWLVARWIEQHGAANVEQFCAVRGADLPVYCRVNILMVSRSELRTILAAEGVVSEEVTFSPHSLRIIEIPSKVRIPKLKSYREGLFFIQDASSTVVADIVASSSPLRVRDLCAAPGGKTCSIALSIAANEGAVYASDRSPQRVNLITELATRLGLSNIETEVFELSDKDNAVHNDVYTGSYDAVLLDVPCSGFGTVGRKIDTRWSTSAQDLAALKEKQLAFLQVAARFVSAGGVLVYSTCSIDKAENEEVIDEFLRLRSDFAREALNDVLPGSMCTELGDFRSWPQRHAMTGAFAARLTKRLKTLRE